MKKLYEKDKVWFAVLWIVIYVIGFANADSISESIGIPKLLTVLVGLFLTVVILRFIKNHNLNEYFGLCSIKGRYKEFLYFIPLIIISSVNLWNGVVFNEDITECILFIVSMCFVGFLEEVIFRGMLFKGMCESNVTSAIIVSSITFGMGHIVNLFLGSPMMETMLQLVYASAIGFCYTIIFYVSNSIYPCIISHIVVNASSIFAIEGSIKQQLIVTMIQTVLSVGYGIWLLKNKERGKKELHEFK